jgi:hypothetical protein
MEMSLAQELIACLQNDSSYFYYYPDRYGVFLLGRAAERCPRIAELRSGPFAPLLHKPRLKALLARQGNGRVSADWLSYHDWDPAAEHYRLSLSTWNGERPCFHWAQTSRRGANLVLQLNFSADHVRRYRHLIRPEGETGSGPFEYSGHPVSRERETLAWVRLDLDWERGEALIEEVQTDWLRRARWASERARRWLAAPAEKRPQSLYRIVGQWTDVLCYYEEWLAFHRRYWDEAALTAALWLIVEVLGLRRVWYHSWESGRLFKRCGEPPRSLYTDLPRRFCFTPVDEAPALIANEKRQKEALKQAMRERVRFFRLDL